KIPQKYEILNNVKINRYSINYCISDILKIADRFFDLDNFNIFQLAKNGPISFKMLADILNYDCDIIVATAFPMFQMYYAYLAKKIADKKIVIQGNLHLENSGYNNALIDKIIDSADGYVCLTEYEYKYLTDKFCSDEKFKIIRPALVSAKSIISEDTKKKIKEKLRISEDKIILYFGQINPTKNLKILIDAFSIVCKKIENCALVIAGATYSQYNIELEKYADSKVLKNKIYFFNNVSDEEKDDIYYSADLYVNPSENESYSITTIEALAFSLPIAISDIAQLSELAANNNGLVFEKGNAEALAEKINLILANSELAQNLKKSALRRFEEYYNNRDYIKVYNDFLIKCSNI
ncbi:MAG TPA: glycosyltransferase family 4 protein, partial [bacterium]|nr:glycosyltransferase family 4 protein [bacterium]